MTALKVAVFSTAIQPSYANQMPLEASFWATGISSTRANYETTLAKLILETTRSAFGPYSMQVKTMDVSFDRGRRAVALGNQVNFFSNPLPSQAMETDSELQLIPLPVMKGLLGYRKLVVRAQDVNKYTSLNSFADLQKLKVGQVSDWADIPVYRSNNIPVVEGTSFENLFYMLSRRRFDYIPLSVGEADQILMELGDKYGALTLVPNVIVYYPFPVFYQVSKNNPVLVERLEKGLEALSATGKIEKLFNEYFQDELALLQQQDYTLFHLMNTNLPEGYTELMPSLAKPAKTFMSPLFKD